MATISATGSPATTSENTGEPLVSVIVIFLNAVQFIEEAIVSVFAQTYSNWELLLVDDGSSDGSTEIAKAWVDRFPEKVRYIEHEGHRNCGMSATRNLGISQARGKYIAFLDADDVWLPNKLERQVPILESQPETAMIYGPAEYWHSWSGKLEDRSCDHVPDLCVDLDTLIEPPTLLMLLYPLGPGTAPPPSSIVVRFDVVKKLGGFEESVPNYYDDQGFLTKVYLTEKVFVSSECLERYRIHAESCCSVVERSGLDLSQRKIFLAWLGQFLRSRDVKDAEIWSSFDDALRLCDNGATVLANNWSLRIAKGNMARLVITVSDPDRVRVHITRSRSEQRFDTQLNSIQLQVHADRRYRLNFGARADSPRSISFGLAQSHAPWATLGLYDEISLSSGWQYFARTFSVPNDDDNARIHFDVGAADPSVELCSVVLQIESHEVYLKSNSLCNRLGIVFPPS